jgi:diaminohydroxyphosphoribosylaminopyrimidine deaminase/5-amino-6-(5-phosphoribosylamino)uracil reductase
MLLGGDKMALGNLGITTLSERIDLDIASVEQLDSDILITAHPTRKDV